MSRNFHDDIRDPNLFTENAAGNYQYETRADGGKSAAGSLRLADSAVRDNQAQASVGGDARRGKDHDWGPDDGGHLIGARFGGSPGEENLTAQSRNLNRSDYKRMENEWAEHLNNGDKVFVFVETDGGDRPTAYMGYVIYESPDGTRDWDVFSFTNESRSEQERWDEELVANETEPPEIYEEMGMHLWATPPRPRTPGTPPTSTWGTRRRAAGRAPARSLPAAWKAPAKTPGRTAIPAVRTTAPTGTAAWTEGGRVWGIRSFSAPPSGIIPPSG